MKKEFLVFSMLLFCLTAVRAQNDKAQKAFATSYELEYAGDYTKAVSELKTICTS